MKIALIGYGVIGKVHINVINNLNENLVGICDIDENKLNGFDENITYTDYKEMLDKTNPDIVHICTPHYLHKEMIIYALERNINVLCEKPICISKEELNEIEIAVRKSNAQLGVCYQNRYEPVILFAKEYLKNKEVVSAHGSLLWHRDAQYYSQASWRGVKKYEGGGVLINQAIHTIDLLQYFYGMPEEITAHIDNVSLKGVIDVEDTAILFSKNNDFSLIASNTAISDFPRKITLKTVDDEIVVFNNEVCINGKKYDCEKLNEIPEAKKIYGGGHTSLIKDFYDCVEKNIKFDIDFYEASKSLKIVLAAYISQGKNIKI
jgi:predicted dehydrogenase